MTSVRKNMFPFPGNWSLRISELGNHVVDLKVINHPDKYKIMLFLDLLVAMQGYMIRVFNAFPFFRGCFVFYILSHSP